MAEVDQESRTEPATQRRRRELRERGQIARSGDLTTAALLLAATAALNFFGADLTINLAEMLRKSLAGAAWSSVEPAMVMAHLRELAQLAARSVIPILAVLVGAAVAINLVQVGFVATTEPLGPDLTRLNPIAGLQRMWSGQGAVAGATGVLKLLVLAAIAAGFLTGQLPALLRVGEYELAGISRQLGSGIVRLGFQLSVGLIVLAVVDYGLQLWRFERRIQMTREELREELRESEGDSHTRQRRREAHRQLIASPRASHETPAR